MAQLFVMAAALAALAGPAEEVRLADALAAIDDANPAVAQARSRAEEAAAVAAKARAALVPSVSAQASWVRNSEEVLIGLPPPLAVERLIQPEEALGVSGTLRVPLVVPSAWHEVGAARAGARAAEATAEASRRRTRAAFAQAAYGARAAEEVVVASEQALESAAELVRSAERRVRAGTAAPLDHLKARTEQVRRESDLARARAELDRARLALGVLLGREAPVRVLVPEAEGDGEDAAGDPATDASPPAGLAAQALGRRAEVAAQAAQVEAARAQLRASRAALAPQLQASASVFAQDVPFPTGEREGWRAGVELLWPLFDGGLRGGRRREAEARLGTAEAAAEAQRLGVIQEVTDATRDLDVARERRRLAASQRALAADAAASARRSFEAGIASSLDVLDANDRLYLADVGLAEGRARVAQARIALDYAAGR